jgi:hypothetical protein
MAVSETRVTRGGLLKRAGVGAAALGAGSMLTASTASASAPASTACIAAGGCGDFQVCPGGTGCCNCYITTEACCFCGEDVYCSGIPTCTSSSQCAPGWSCCPNTGCGAGGICIPHCGAITHHNVCGGTAPPQLIGTKTSKK